MVNRILSQEEMDRLCASTQLEDELFGPSPTPPREPPPPPTVPPIRVPIRIDVEIVVRVTMQ